METYIPTIIPVFTSEKCPSSQLRNKVQMRLSRPFVISPNGVAKIDKEIETWKKTYTSIYQMLIFRRGATQVLFLDVAYWSRNRGEVSTFTKGRASQRAIRHRLGKVVVLCGFEKSSSQAREELLLRLTRHSSLPQAEFFFFPRWEPVGTRKFG